MCLSSDSQKCVCVHLVHNEYQNTHRTIKVGTFVLRGAILAGRHNFKGLFKVQVRAWVRG